MAVKITADVIKGASSSTTIFKGNADVRIYTVEGVVGDGYAKLQDVKKLAGIPQIGQPHPNDVSTIVTQVSTVGVSSDIITLAIRYAPPDIFNPTKDQIIITGGSSLTNAETNLDVNGNVITTTYTYPNPYPEYPHLAGETRTHGAMVQKLVPTSRIGLTRLEDDLPLFFSADYIGRINSIPFLGAPAGYWLCTEIPFDSQDGGKTYRTSYNFEYKYDTWAQQVVFMTPSGDPPAFQTPKELALGVTNAHIYPTINFNQLGLDFS